MCLDETQLIKLVSGELPAARRAAAEAHLATCPACRMRTDELRETWQQLGAWEAPPPATDFTARVLERARVERVEPIAAGGRSSRLPAMRALRLGRVAAAIVAAAGAGMGGGLLLPAGNGQAAQSQVQASEVMWVLGLDEISEPAGLAGFFLDDPPVYESPEEAL